MRRNPRFGRPSASLAISLLALFVSLGGASYAATGGNFVLGQSNTATTASTLTANVSGKALTLKNTSTAAGATALNLNVAAGRPPFMTSSAVKVANLNADNLDGQDSTAFLGVGDSAVNTNLLDGLDSTDFLGATQTAVDSELLDGKDSKDFARLGGLVNGDGTVLQGTGYTVSRLSDGEYQVTFPQGTLSNAMCPPVVVAIPFSGLVRHPQLSARACSGLGAGSFTLKLLDNDGVAHDTPFLFLAM